MTRGSIASIKLLLQDLRIHASQIGASVVEAGELQGVALTGRGNSIFGRSIGPAALYSDQRLII